MLTLRSQSGSRQACVVVLLACTSFIGATQAIGAQLPLHARIDALIEAGAKGQPMATAAEDAEFLRRVYLDFTGSIPSADVAEKFFADQNADKRSKLIHELASGDSFSQRLADLFHIMLMERRGDSASWQQYLLASFKANKPWNQLAQEILSPDARNEQTRASAFFYTRRLEKVGEQETDYPGLTRDVGRLFLGIDLQCAQCHNHLTVDDYKQADFQGLFAFYQNIAIHSSEFPAIAEKPTVKKIEFASVFNKKPKETGPRVPTLPEEREIAIPVFEKGKEFMMPADTKTKLPGVLAFSPLEQLSKQLPTAENGAFARNMANRLWFLMMGRGLVDPLDLHHSGNPPSHPELLQLLAKEFAAHGYDVKWMIRELALTKTYQRSSILPSGSEPKVDRFTVALERRLSYEQLLQSMLTASGQLDMVMTKDRAGDKPLPAYEDLRKKFAASFAAETKEAEEHVDHTLKAALFVRNDVAFLALLQPRAGNLIQKLLDEKDDAKLAHQLYLSVLTRKPLPEETAAVAAFLKSYGEQRATATGDLAWALLTSSEFMVNH